MSHPALPVVTSPTSPTPFSDRVLARLDPEWLELLQQPGLPGILSELSDRVEEGLELTPPPEKIFEFARLTPLSKLRVVILGQDPYPKRGDAHGLAFSCLGGVPASLQNVFACLRQSRLLSEVPTSGDLTYLAKQGILLLNRALTTVVGVSKIHTRLWSAYTQRLLVTLSERYNPFFLLWGNDARAVRPHLKNPNRVLEYTHPSPLAQTKASFLDCSHFLELHSVLTDPPILWDPREFWANHNPVVETLSPAYQKFNLVSERHLAVFVDGVSWNNSPHGGHAVLWLSGQPVTESDWKEKKSGGTREPAVASPTFWDGLTCYVKSAKSSRFRAQGEALLCALERLQAHTETWDEAQIVVTSEFWKKLVYEYGPRWALRKNGFEEKKNPDLTFPIYKLFKSFRLCKKLDLCLVDEEGLPKTAAALAELREGSYERVCAENLKYVRDLASYAASSPDLEVGTVTSEYSGS